MRNNPRNPNKTILFGEQAIFHLIIFLFNNFSNTCFHKLKFLISLNPQLVHLRLYKKIQNDYATPESSQQFAPKQQEHTKLKKKNRQWSLMTTNQQTTTSHHKPPTNSRKPPANDHKPTANNHKPPQTTTNHQQTTTIKKKTNKIFPNSNYLVFSWIKKKKGLKKIQGLTAKKKGHTNHILGQPFFETYYLILSIKD